MSRNASVERKTKETHITVRIDLDGTGESKVDTGIGFFDHMLNHLARHSLCDLEISCKGDLHVDSHHTVEDVGIVLGQAISQALGNKVGIRRYGWAVLPMDEALIMTALDISGRGSLYYEVELNRESIGTFDCELAQEFFKAVAVNAGINLHIRKLAGSNAHHIVEAIFKSFAQALRSAIARDERVMDVPSTKGVL